MFVLVTSSPVFVSCFILAFQVVLELIQYVELWVPLGISIFFVKVIWVFLSSQSLMLILRICHLSEYRYFKVLPVHACLVDSLGRSCLPVNLKLSCKLNESAECLQGT